MIDLESYRQNAVHCVQQAQAEAAPEDTDILLNIALAWLRLAQQVQASNQASDRAMNYADSPPTALDRHQGLDRHEELDSRVMAR